mmetsp:Transcript_3353/g.10367  ORF Transcript_3353/g.10367 Transcript_3353/m.10367 type:complete len:274 (+) Transcript_3353:1489-2310(+)|eukprot:scaffold245393_cov31-Tisochrysis_lutea.AAC.2
MLFGSLRKNGSTPAVGNGAEIPLADAALRTKVEATAVPAIACPSGGCGLTATRCSCAIDGGLAGATTVAGTCVGARDGEPSPTFGTGGGGEAGRTGTSFSVEDNDGTGDGGTETLVAPGRTPCGGSGGGAGAAGGGFGGGCGSGAAAAASGCGGDGGGVTPRTRTKAPTVRATMLSTLSAPLPSLSAAFVLANWRVDGSALVSSFGERSCTPMPTASAAVPGAAVVALSPSVFADGDALSQIWPCSSLRLTHRELGPALADGEWVIVASSLAT